MASPEDAFFAAARKAEIAKMIRRQIDEACVALMKKSGGQPVMIQDPMTKVVYEVKQCAGQWVENRPCSYDHTPLLDGAKGKLSIKRAREAGFDL